MATPYDGKIGLWHVSGAWVPETTVDTFIQNIKTNCPSADAVFIKTSNDTRWMGQIDTKTAFKINGPADIAKWVAALSAAGLEFHAWCVITGSNVQAESQLIIDACKVPGVKSMILDVEPHSGYWVGTATTVTAMMTAVRNALGTNFHIGMSVDPRKTYYTAISPDAWKPYINSIHPQVYWQLMGRTPEDVLSETYLTWGGFGAAIIPVLQAFDVRGDSIKTAQDIARSKRGAPGVSYFRLGKIDAGRYQAINQEVVTQEIGPDNIRRTYGSVQVISPGLPGYMDGTQTGQPSSALFKQFTSANGALTKYKSTASTSDSVWAQWNPTLPGPGLYEISVYVPGRHASSLQAKYHVHGVTGIASELLVKLNQNLYYDVWVPLLVYDFSGLAGSGQVNLTDLTGEVGKEIAFTGIRWRKVVMQEQVVTAGGVGFDPPVGTAAERTGSQVWPGQWFDATGYATYYTTVGAAYHTGADLNLPGNVDKDMPIYATCGGIVTYSGLVSGSTWGQIIVIRHDPLADGKVVWSRYAHIENRIVKAGDRVERGQQIAQIGNAEGQLAYHLHFDIAKTSVLETNAAHWPGNNLTSVQNNYADPRQWVIDHRPAGR